MPYEMAFVSHTNRHQRPYYDPSTRYRAFALAEHFRRQGRSVAFLSQVEFEAEIESFSTVPLILFHRPSASDAMLRFVARNRNRQKLIADYDDLVFDVTCTRETPAVRDRGEDPAHIARVLAANAEIGAMFHLRTASTQPLAARATEVLGGETVTIHNSLDPVYLDLAKVLLRQPDTHSPRFDIGYFSGTASHNRDFLMIAPQIAAYLKENKTRKMLLFGPVAIPAALVPFKDRITQRPVVSFYEMPQEIMSCRMVLGPLEDNAFARCKSGLKFFEAGVLGVPVAATPIPDIDRFESSLLHKCGTPAQWEAALRAPNPSPELRRKAATRVALDAGADAQVAIWTKHFLEA